MPTFSVRLCDATARSFDQVAGMVGGRSVLLRRLIAQAATAEAGEPATPRLYDGRPVRIMVRLTQPDAIALDREAHAMGLSRAAWVAGLVRRRVRDRPTFARPDEIALIAIQGELRRIGVNINQIARALNTAVLEGRVLELELGEVRDLCVEIRSHMAAVREAFVGNLSYWETPR